MFDCISISYNREGNAASVHIVQLNSSKDIFMVNPIFFFFLEHLYFDWNIAGLV